MSPRSKEANEALHDERSKTILETALHVFVEKGFEGTRIQEIARRSGMSYGLVYHYFPTKEAVFTALVEQALDAAKSLTQFMRPDMSPRELSSIIGFALADPSPLYFALIVEALTKQSVPAELAEKARKSVLGIKDTFASIGGVENTGKVGSRGDGILALLLGASIMKTCGISDGAFASSETAILASASRG